MVLVQLFGRTFQVVNGPGTTPNGNFALRSAPPWAGATSAEELVGAMSSAQIDALTTMAAWAETNLDGVTGTTTLNGKTVPQAAARMAEEWRGSDFGGMSQAEQRRRQKGQRIDVDDIEAAAPGAAPNGNGM